MAVLLLSTVGNVCFFHRESQKNAEITGVFDFLLRFEFEKNKKTKLYKKNQTKSY